MSSDDWDIVNCEPSAREKKAQKERAGYADQDSPIVAQRYRREKGIYRPHVGNLVMFPWGCRSVWNGRHITGASEPDWQGPVIVTRGEIVSQMPVS